jgi:hypothetical protein
MSQENVEMVRGLWEPFKGVDLAAVDWDDEAIRKMAEVTHVYEVRDHMITRVDEYDTLKEALEAVGLSEPDALG